MNNFQAGCLDDQRAFQRLPTELVRQAREWYRAKIEETEIACEPEQEAAPYFPEES